MPRPVSTVMISDEWDIRGPVFNAHYPNITPAIADTYAYMRGSNFKNQGPLFACSGPPSPLPFAALQFNKEFQEKCTSNATTGLGIMPNHYLADEAYGNYGYVKINGKWVDPDRADLVFRAENDPDKVETPVVPSGRPAYVLPFETSFKTCFGSPRIRKNEEYKAFLREVDGGSVSEDRDFEGDPFIARVTPKTFLKWTTGAVKADSYVREPISEVISSFRKELKERRGLPKLEIYVAQYDEVTGDQMTPAYSIDRSPNPLDSPCGVNMGKIPNAFSYSYPKVLTRHERATFFDAGIDDEPAPSLPEIFTTADVKAALANESDPDSGDRVFSEVEAYMESLLTSRNSTVEAYNHTAAVNNALEGQIHQLEREVQVLRLRVQEQEKSAQRRHRDRCQEMIKDRVERLNQDLAQAQQAQKEVDERNNRLREQAGQLVEERGKLMAVLSVSPAQLPAPYFNPVVQMIETD